MNRSEFSANIALQAASVAHIGRNFAKPIPRLVKPVQKSFVQRLLAMKK